MNYQPLLTPALCALVSAALVTGADAQRWQRSTDNEGVYSRTVIHPDETRTLDKRDINNKILEKRTLDKNGVLLMKSLFELNADQKPINGLVYDGRNRLLYRSEFVYDGSDRLREERIFQPDGTPVRRLIYKPDRTGRMQPAFAYSYVDGKEVSSAEGDYANYSTNSPHAYRGSTSGSGNVANTATAYRAAPRASDSQRTTSRPTKRKRDRIRIFRRR